jgi:two-component system phosphate regulon response regulator PhoB
VKPLIIGIAGGTGSGKTTVARNIARALPDASVAFLDMDGYYRNFAHLPLDERRKINWDHPEAFDLDLFASHLEQLARGDPIEKPVYDFATHVRSQRTERITPADVVVVDGILLFVDQRIRALFDVKVFVDADPDIRLVRRIQRDMSERDRPLEEILQQYLTTVRPMHPAVRGTWKALRRHHPSAWRAERRRHRDDSHNYPEAHRSATGMTQNGSSGGERILVVDDEPDIVALVVYHLAKAGFKISTASNGADALRMAQQDRPALVVLDLMLPGMSGLEVLDQLRADESGQDIAVLLLTARREEPDRIKGLSSGADDYLTKPFSPQELVLRVRNILRRMSQAQSGLPDVLRVGAILIDRSAHRVTVENAELDLTPTEFKLLMTLAERRGRVQSRALLLEIVWDAAPDIQTRTVDMHVQRLRTKLGAAGDMIETVRGFGYRLRAAPPSRVAL